MGLLGRSGGVVVGQGDAFLMENQDNQESTSEWIFKDFLGFSRSFRGLLWILLDFHEISGISVDFLGFSMNFMDFHGFSGP